MGRFADTLRKEMEPENPLRSGDTQVALIHFLARLEALEAEEQQAIEQATDKALERMGHPPYRGPLIRDVRAVLKRRRDRRGEMVTEPEIEAPAPVDDDPEGGWFFSVQGMIRFEDGEGIFDEQEAPELEKDATG